jgi:hypothetical protein
MHWTSTAHRLSDRIVSNVILAGVPSIALDSSGRSVMRSPSFAVGISGGTGGA